MKTEATPEHRSRLALLLLHVAAAAVCFTFLTVVAIVVCLLTMMIGNDPGGPLFFPIFVLCVLFFAGLFTVILALAVLVSDLLRRRYRIPLWVPPLIVFGLATIACRLFFSHLDSALAFVGGGLFMLAFVIHWAAISTVWFLPRLLFRVFRVQ